MAHIDTIHSITDDVVVMGGALSETSEMGQAPEGYDFLDCECHVAGGFLDDYGGVQRALTRTHLPYLLFVKHNVSRSWRQGAIDATEQG